MSAETEYRQIVYRAPLETFPFMVWSCSVGDHGQD